MKVSLCGFYGKANMGDDGMLWGLLHALRQVPGIQLALHCACDLAHQKALEKTYKLPAHRNEDRKKAEWCDLFLMGGGDLGPSFGATAAMHAMICGRRVAGIGQTYSAQWLARPNLTRAYLREFSVVAPRESASLARVRSLGIDAMLGADPVFLAPRHSRPSQPERVVILATAISTYRTGIEEILPALLERLRDREVIFCNCTTDDKPLRGSEGYRVVRYEGCPKRVQEVVSSAGLVISLAKLHPAVFAVKQRVPCVALDYQSHHPPGRVEGFCIDAGIPCLRWGERQQLPDLLGSLPDVASMDRAATAMELQSRAMLAAVLDFPPAPLPR